MISVRAGDQFSRAMRLTRARDIARVFRIGLGFSTPYVIIKAHRRGGTSTARLAFAIARKHVGSAVRRNRAKRIVRESFRCHAETIRGFDVVVVSRPGLRDVKGRTLRQVMDGQWSRVAAGGNPGGSQYRARRRLLQSRGVDQVSVRTGGKRHSTDNHD